MSSTVHTGVLDGAPTGVQVGSPNNTSIPTICTPLDSNWFTGTGGLLSCNQARSPVPYPTLCSSVDILKEKPSAVMERTYLYATAKLDKFHEMNRMDNGLYRGDIVYIERGQDGRPEHAFEQSVPGIRQEWGQIKILSELPSADPSRPKFEIECDKMYCSCRRCIKGEEDKCSFRSKFLNAPVKMIMESKHRMRGYRCIYCQSTFLWFAQAIGHQYNCKVSYPSATKTSPHELDEKAKLRFVSAGVSSEHQQLDEIGTLIQSDIKQVCCAKCEKVKGACDCPHPEYGGIIRCPFQNVPKHGIECKPHFIKTEMITTGKWKSFDVQNTSDFCYQIISNKCEEWWVIAIDGFEIRSKEEGDSIIQRNKEKSYEIVKYPKLVQNIFK